MFWAFPLKSGRVFRCNPLLRGFWKKPAYTEFISVWQSFEHIASPTRNTGIFTSTPNANFDIQY
jgi:hypothetical protein